MSEETTPTRVLAISHTDTDAKKVYSFGEGNYVGDKPIPEEVSKILAGSGMTNPCIELDSGEVVWGMECWWGHVEGVKAQIPDDWTWETTTVAEFRKRRGGGEA